MTLAPLNPSTELSVDHQQWLPQLMRRIGPAARTLWLMHEPPACISIGKPETTNPDWRTAVERFLPRLVISGHDHFSPILNRCWHVRLGSSVCVNVGQPKTVFHFVIADFEFSSSSPALPVNIHVQAFPQGERITL